MGTTFKENVSDIRNSKVADVVYEIQEFGLKVDVIDPYADTDQVLEEYGYKLQNGPSGKYHAIVVAVSHDEYSSLEENDFKEMLVENGVLADLKGIYRNKITDLNYWSL